jgi:hypothetical protein
MHSSGTYENWSRQQLLNRIRELEARMSHASQPAHEEEERGEKNEKDITLEREKTTEVTDVMCDNLDTLQTKRPLISSESDLISSKEQRSVKSDAVKTDEPTHKDKAKVTEETQPSSIVKSNYLPVCDIASPLSVEPAFVKRKIALRVAYLGWDYHGFSRQKSGISTVEVSLLFALFFGSHSDNFVA